MDNKPESLQNPNRSADKKYYASGNPSALNPLVRAGKTRIRTPAYVDPSKARQADLPRSADVYYKDPDEARLERMAAPSQASPGMIVVLTRDALAEKVGQAIVEAAVAPVRVALADVAWLGAARMQVDLAVSRERITEDQGRDILFGLYAPEADRAIETNRPVKEVDAEAVEDEQFAVTADTPVPTAKDLAEAEDALREGFEAVHELIETDKALEFTAPAPQEDNSDNDDDSDDEQFAVPETKSNVKEDSQAAPVTDDAVD